MRAGSRPSTAATCRQARASPTASVMMAGKPPEAARPGISKRSSSIEVGSPGMSRSDFARRRTGRPHGPRRRIEPRRRPAGRAAFASSWLLGRWIEIEQTANSRASATSRYASATSRSRSPPAASSRRRHSAGPELGALPRRDPRRCPAPASRSTTQQGERLSLVRSRRAAWTRRRQKAQIAAQSHSPQNCARARRRRINRLVKRRPNLTPPPSRDPLDQGPHELLASAQPFVIQMHRHSPTFFIQRSHAIWPRGPRRYQNEARHRASHTERHPSV